MKILWMTWKDREHPEAGGAEVVNEEIAKRLAKAGHEVRFLVARFGSSAVKVAEERVRLGLAARSALSEASFSAELPTLMRDGLEIIRVGGRYSVYWRAYRYYKQHLQDWPDLVIDEVNTIPFFAKFYVKQENILLSYQLCREIWFYQMFFPLNILGYLLEPLYLWLLRDRKVLTESESTKVDLQRFGFKKDNIRIFSVGLEVPPISEAAFQSQQKAPDPSILYFGSIRDMKRPDHVLKAFELAKKSIPNLKLAVAGSGKSPYAKKFFAAVAASPYAFDITCHGRVSNEQKLELMRQAHILAVTSVKEGWGLVVTEANSQGTPAVVYDTDGLRDSCKNGVTGIVIKPNPAALAEGVVQLLQNKPLYETYRKAAWELSKHVTFDKGYEEVRTFLRSKEL